MRKYAFLLAIMLLAVNMAYANECERQTMPEGFKCIEGSRGITIYNPEQLDEVFDSYEEDDGALVLKHALPGSDSSESIGYVHGKLELLSAQEKQIRISSGGFVSALEKSNATVEGDEFIISAKEMPALDFGLSDALYIANDYSIMCKNGEEECALKARVEPQETYADIEGEGVAVNAPAVNAYKESGEAEEGMITRLKNMGHIIISNETNLTITGIPKRNSYFGKMKVEAESEVKLEHRAYPENFYIITADRATVTPEPDTSFAYFSKNTEENAEGISIIINGYPMLKLTRGYMIMPKAKAVYDWCAEKGWEEENIEFDIRPRLYSDLPDSMKSSEDFLYLAGCGFIDNLMNELHFQPRTYTEEPKEIPQHRGDIEYPFTLAVKLPAASTYRKIFIERFETFSATSSVTLEKEDVESIKLLFYRENVLMPEESIGNWIDIGTGFSTYVFYENRFQHFECNIQSNENYVCMLDGRVWARNGEFTPQRMRRCSDARACDEGSDCIEGLCVIKRECTEIGDANEGVWNSGRLDILFAADDYRREGDFIADAKKVIDKGGSYGFNGLMTVEPYKSNGQRVWFWSLYGESVPLNIRGNIELGVRYINSLRRKCPQVDTGILLSDSTFISFSEPEMNALISMKTISAGGNGLLLAHEFGHSFGNMWDEYYKPVSGKNGLFGEPNCLRNENEARSVWNRLLGPGNEQKVEQMISDAKQWNSDESIAGCGGSCGNACKSYFRPSFNSIMRHQMKQSEEGWDTYNSVSEAWLLNRINSYS